MSVIENKEEVPAVNPVLLGAVEKMGIPVTGRECGFGWQIAEIEVDGKKMAAAVLSISDGNGVHLYFFGTENMHNFVGAAMQMGTIQQLENAKLNPLQTANVQDMTNLINLQGSLTRPGG